VTISPPDPRKKQFLDFFVTPDGPRLFEGIGGVAPVSAAFHAGREE
jgi:hypothetical protein